MLRMVSDAQVVVNKGVTTNAQNLEKRTSDMKRTWFGALERARRAACESGRIGREAVS